MSSTLRLSIIMVLLLSTTALGLIAYNSMNKVPQPSPENPPASFTQVPSKGYFVAKKPLRVGTLAKEDDFEFTPLTPGKDPPPEAITGARDAIARLGGSLVRRFLDKDSPVTSKNILSPQDRGFLASVLEAGKRAISIEVDAESGVSRLIWPGDHVDVVLTQEIDKDKPRSTMSETILQDVRIIAIDLEIEQGQSAQANNATGPGKPEKPQKHPVSLELKPDEVQKIAVAKKLGTLSLAIRPDEIFKRTGSCWDGSSGWSTGSALACRATGYRGHPPHYVKPRCIAGNCPPASGNCSPEGLRESKSNCPRECNGDSLWRR